MAVTKRVETNVFGKPVYVYGNPEFRSIEYEVYQPSNEFCLWSIKPLTGQVPKELEGRWTNYQDAETTVKLFLEGKTGAKSRVKPEA